jgi:predicted DNA-binding transcriptional regulator AlpA
MNPNDKLIKRADIVKIIPISPQTWSRWVKNKKAPQPFCIGTEKFWSLAEVHAFIASMRTA